MHLRFSLLPSVAIACLALFTVWVTWQAKMLEKRQDEGSSTVDRQAPGSQLTSLDGQTFALADFHGKKNVVLNFWASWCGPCRIELPALVSFYERTHKPDSDYEILAISIDEYRDSAEGAAASMKPPFPVLFRCRPEGRGRLWCVVDPDAFRDR